MTEEISVVCIMCPVGCEVKIERDDSKITKIEGYGCEDGKEYAEQEVSSPRRIIMSVVKCIGGDFPTVSVKTSDPIRKGMVDDVMDTISDVRVKAPVCVGDIVIKNVCELDVDVVATRNVEKTEE